MTESTGVRSADERRRRRGFVKWLLVEGDRVAVSAILLFVLFVGLSGLALLGLTTVRSTAPLFYLFGAFIGGNFTLIAIVISINQLVLSRQLSTPGELRTQFRDMATFRQAAASATGQVPMPILPPSFTQTLLAALEEDTRTLEDSVSGVTDDAVRTELHDLATDLREDLTEISALLDESEASPFHALSATLDMNLGRRLQQAQSLRSRPREAVSEQTREALDGLVDHLELLDVSREYFKTLFMQMELSYLTRALLYVGVPAELTATLALLSLGAAPGSTVPRVLQFPVVPAAITLSLAPLVVLLAFVLRITLVTERTVAITPFTTPKQVS